MISNSVFCSELEILFVLVGALVYITVDDLRNFRIRNDLVLLILALFAVLCVVKWDWGFASSHVAFGSGMFVLLVLMYARGWMGGGDVKLLAAGFLWLGLERAMPFTLLLSAFTFIYIAGDRYFAAFPSRATPAGVKVPYGPSISLAWIVSMLLSA